MRVSHAAVALVLIGLACVGVEGAEVVDQVVAASEVAQVAVAQPKQGAGGNSTVVEKKVDAKEVDDAKPSYFKIVNQRMSYMSKREDKGKTLKECQALCDAARDRCKSFTYKVEEKDCSWSPETLGIDPIWTYFTKEKPGVYDVTEGMKYESRKDRVLTDATKEECEKSCDAGRLDDACRGYGYCKTLKKCGIATDGLEWDVKSVLYLKAPNPDEPNETMENLRLSKLPEQEKAANVESITRYMATTQSARDKARSKELDKKADIEAKQLKAKAAEEAVTKIKTKERIDKYEERQAAERKKVADEKQAKTDKKAKETAEKGEEASNKYTAAETAKEKAAAEAEAAKVAYEKQQAAKAKAKADLEAAEAAQAPQKELQKLREQQDKANKASEQQRAKMHSIVQAVEKMKEAAGKSKAKRDESMERDVKSVAESKSSSEKQDKADTAEKETKLQQAMQERNNKLLEKGSRLKAEAGIKVVREGAVKTSNKLKADAIEVAKKQSADGETKEKSIAKKKAERLKAEEKEQKAIVEQNAEKASEEKESKEDTFKKEEKAAAGAKGVEASLKLDVRHLKEKAQGKLTRGKNLARQLTTGLNKSGQPLDNAARTVLIAKEGAMKESAEKLERTAMESRTEMQSELKRKAASKAKKQAKDDAEAAAELHRKKQFHISQLKKKDKKINELKSKKGELKEADSKKEGATKLHFEKLTKAEKLSHLQKVQWLKVKHKEHSTKESHSKSIVTEMKSKRAHVVEVAAEKAAVEAKIEKKKATIKAQQEAKKAAEEKAAEEKRVHEEKMAVAKKVALEALHTEQATKMDIAQEADSKEKVSKAEDNKLKKQEMGQKDDERQAKSEIEKEQKEGIRVELAGKMKEQAEEQKGKATILEGQQKQKAAKDEKIGKKFEAASKKAESDGKAEAKEKNEQRSKSEAAAKATAAANARVASEKSAKTTSSLQSAQNDMKEKGIKLAALEAEKVMKKVHSEKESTSKKSEARAKSLVKSEEVLDKRHEAEQDTKESRTKRSPFNMTYTKNWETDVDPGFSGAYSYIWEKFCVLGGTLSSVGNIAKERLHKKHFLFGKLQARGIRAHFWGKLGPQTTMGNAMKAAELTKTTKSEWIDSLDYPLGGPNKPWRFLNDDYLSEFAANFTGHLKVVRGGAYKFWVTTTGLTELWIGEREVVLNNKLNSGSVEKEGFINLEPGPQIMDLMYYTRDPNPGLKVEWEGPDHRREILTSADVGTEEKRTLISQFRGIDKAGWMGTFWGGIGMVNNVAEAMMKSKSLTPKDTSTFNANYRHFLLDAINFSDENSAFWPGLSSNFEYRFAAKFTGNLLLQEEGLYTFYLESIDGAILRVDGKVVCDNDGLHKKKTVDGTLQLAPGTPSIEVTYFDAHHGSLLKIGWKGPQTGFKKVMLTGAGDNPSVGQFKESFKLRRLLSQADVYSRLDNTPQLGEANPEAAAAAMEKKAVAAEEPQKDEPKKTEEKALNRRRAYWDQDAHWGVASDADPQECDCEKDTNAHILTSMKYHRRRRASSRRRFQKKTDPDDETMVLLQTSVDPVAAAAAGASAGADAPPADTPPEGMTCKCTLPPKKGGFKADLWSNIVGLTSLTKAVMKVHGKPPDISKIAWNMQFMAEGGFWDTPALKLDYRFMMNFVAAFEGFVPIKEDGNHNFFLTSADGAELYVNNDKVIDNDGIHRMQENSGSVVLKKGDLARIRVYFFMALGGAPGLVLQWQAPGMDKKATLDGDTVWARATKTIGNPGEDAPVLVRRRFVTKTPVELSADELSTCGVKVGSGNTGHAGAPQAPPTTVSEMTDGLDETAAEIASLTQQVAEAEERSVHHPVESARVKYVEIAQAMKERLKQLKASKGEQETQIQVATEGTPNIAPQPAGVPAPAMDAPGMPAGGAAMPAGKAAGGAAMPAGGAAMPAGGAAMPAGKAAGGAAMPAGGAAAPPMLQTELLQLGEDPMDEDEVMEPKAAMEVMTKSRELTVKDKCSKMITEEKAFKNKSIDSQATELKHNEEHAKVAEKLKKGQCDGTAMNLKSAEANPSATDEMKLEASVANKKCQDELKDRGEAVGKASLREDLIKKRVISIEQRAKESESKEKAINDMEVTSKSEAKKVKKVTDAQLKEEEKLVKVKEAGNKKAQVEKIAQLPVDCRPYTTSRFMAQTKNGQHVPVEISPKGEVTTLNGDYRLVSLDGIMFARTSKSNNPTHIPPAEYTPPPALDLGESDVVDSNKGVSLGEGADPANEETLDPGQSDRKWHRSSYSGSQVENHACRDDRLQGIGWCAANSGYKDNWLQIDTGKIQTIVGIKMAQRRDASSQYVTSFKLSFSDTSGGDFRYAKEGGVDKVYTGNTNTNDEVTVRMQDPVAARFIRLTPQAYHSHMSMRWAVIVSDEPIQPKWDEVKTTDGSNVSGYCDTAWTISWSQKTTSGLNGCKVRCKEKGPNCAGITYGTVAGEHNNCVICKTLASVKQSTANPDLKTYKLPDTEAKKKEIEAKAAEKAAADAKKAEEAALAKEEELKAKNPVPMAWDEKKTKAAFDKIMDKYNDPDVWTLCSQENGVCKDQAKYKMKFGTDGKFRYRVADGDIPCTTDVFGEIPGIGSQKKRCYKYTPHIRRRRATGIFKDVKLTGIKSEWWGQMGEMANMAAAQAKSKTQSVNKLFNVKHLTFPETVGFWDRLDTRFINYFFCKFTGVMMIKKTGRYKFYLTADDGAALYIDGSATLALQNDGPKTEDCGALDTAAAMDVCIAKKTVTAEANILKGTPKFELDFFNNKGMHWLDLQWSGDDFSKRPVTDELIGQVNEDQVEEGGKWKTLANQYQPPSSQTYTLTAETEIRYGVHDEWVYKVFAPGAMQCSPATFGDPDHSVPQNGKKCEKRLDSTGTHWRPCAVEGQMCKGFPGNHRIRFGARGKYEYLETSGNTMCNSDMFGDPAPGLKKQCFVLEIPPKPEVKKMSGSADDDALNAVPEGDTKPYNMARFNRHGKVTGGRASQVSTAPFGTLEGSGQARNAIDGNHAGNFAKNQCTHTYSATNPWWRVQLPTKGVIFSVKIYGRTDKVKNCDHPSEPQGDCDLNHLNVFVSDSPVPGSGKACLQASAHIDASGTTIGCNHLAGRYVSIVKEGLTSLSLCEVQVMGAPVSLVSAPHGSRGLPTPPPPVVPTYPGSVPMKLDANWQPVSASEGPPQVTWMKAIQDEYSDNTEKLCVLKGSIQVPQEGTPDSTSQVGFVPDNCTPDTPQTFMVANGVTGSADILIFPDGKIKATNFFHKYYWERDELSLNGVYYIATKGAKQVAEKRHSSMNYAATLPQKPAGFTSKRYGPLCLLWGEVGGMPGDSVGTVPADCRPSQKLVLHAQSTNKKAWISIDTSGNVVLETAGPVAPKYEQNAAQIEQLDPNQFNGIGWTNPLGINTTEYESHPGYYPRVLDKEPPLTQRMADIVGKPLAPEKGPSEMMSRDWSSSSKGGELHGADGREGSAEKRYKSDAKQVQRLGERCEHMCNNQLGKCGYCGKFGYCCKKDGNNNKDTGCNGSMGFKPDTGTCTGPPPFDPSAARRGGGGYRGAENAAHEVGTTTEELSRSELAKLPPPDNPADVPMPAMAAGAPPASSERNALKESREQEEEEHDKSTGGKGGKGDKGEWGAARHSEAAAKWAKAQKGGKGGWYMTGKGGKGGKGQQLIELGETGVSTEKISISLAGIVYIVADHHVYTRKARSTQHTTKELAEKAGAKVLEKGSDCDLPMLKNGAALEEIKMANGRLTTVDKQLTDAKNSLSTAHPVGRPHFAKVVEEKTSEVVVLTKAKNKTEENERDIKAKHMDCFRPKKVASPEEFLDDMCKNWNGLKGDLKPDCCNQEGSCTPLQISTLLASVKVKGTKLFNLKKKYDKIKFQGQHAQTYSRAFKKMKLVEAEAKRNDQNVHENSNKQRLIAAANEAFNPKPAPPAFKAPDLSASGTRHSASSLAHLQSTPRDNSTFLSGLAVETLEEK